MHNINVVRQQTELHLYPQQHNTSTKRKYNTSSTRWFHIQVARIMKNLWYVTVLHFGRTNVGLLLAEDLVDLEVRIVGCNDA
jgi:hypothetical protein